MPEFKHGCDQHLFGDVLCVGGIGGVGGELFVVGVEANDDEDDAWKLGDETDDDLLVGLRSIGFKLVVDICRVDEDLVLVGDDDDDSGVVVGLTWLVKVKKRKNIDTKIGKLSMFDFR